MRHITRTIAIALLVLAPAGLAAQTTNLSSLQAQIAALQALIAGQTTQQTTTQSSGSGAGCVTLTQSFGRGDTHDEVRALQAFLVDEGYLNTAPSGFFGALTESALKQWQSANGIDPVGRTGPATRAALACSGGSSNATVISNQCPTIAKPATCANATSVQLNGCTVGWQCTVPTLPAQTFTASPVSGPTPLVVKFRGVVTSDNAGFCAGSFCAATLVFGDGTTGAVPLPNAVGSALSYEVSHTYTKGGPFIANLYQGAAGSGAAVVGNGITISPIAPVVPGAPTISVTPTTGTAPMNATVMVQNVTSGANLSIEFGDGTFGSVQPIGTGFGATHTYNTGGSFTIKLRRTNGAGDSCVSATCQVLASTGLSITSAQVASAALAPTPASGLAPLQVTFFANGASVAYTGGVVLDFGDNTSEMICSPGVLCGQGQIQHTYSTAGTYNVQLLGLNSGNNTTILRQATVSVHTPQSTSLTAAPASGPVPLAVTFTGHGGNKTYANGAILKYGDDSTEVFCTAGELCGQKTKTHTYVDGSQYGAQLIALESGTASTTLGTATINATGGTTKIKVTGPNGVFRKGESVSISWTVRGTKPTSGSLSFDLYTPAGVRIGSILTITNFQTGSATWKIPSSQDKNCTGTQPNGLCGVNIAPGMYKITPNVSGLSAIPELTSESSFEIKDELIEAGGFTVSITPNTVEVGRDASIKYRVANPPAGGGVALWMVKPSGQSMGLIAGKLDADTEVTTYPWKAGITQPCVAAIFNPAIACSMVWAEPEPGTYHILAKVYTPLLGNFTTSDVTVHAIATSSAFTLKAAGTGAACIVLSNNLSPGDTDSTSGGEVSKLQEFLAQDATIYPEGTISGFYGNATRRAVERYQASKGIVTTGSPETNGYGAVGPTTRAAIAANCGNASYNFRGTPLSGRAPLSVSFSANTSGVTGKTFTIDFGDGESAAFSGSAVSHTYQTFGTYIAKLNVTGGGSTTVGGTATVRVSNTTLPPPSACAAITRTLSLEDSDATTGGDVSRLQQYLAADPTLYPEGQVTGYYGGLTEKAVKRYQASKGIAQTGNVGPATLKAIRCVPATEEGGIFSAKPVSGVKPLAVTFTTDVEVTSGSYRVNFGDGTSQWLTSRTTSHTYTTDGTYSADLIRSIGNCFGLQNEALRLCELGTSEVLATKVITVSNPAGMSVNVSPASVAMQGNLTVSWTTANAPVGSVVRLEVYRDGSPEPAPTFSNDQGLASDSSSLSPIGNYTWTLPAAGGGIMVDGGFGGYAMAPGTYHITAKLYSGSNCWGFCSSVPERTVHAVGKSGSFTVTATVATPGTSANCGRKEGGSSLGVGESWVSCNGQYKLTHQSDGNVVFYRVSDSAALWSTNTQGSGTSLHMQGDGNFVLYRAGGTVPGNHLWHSVTHGNPGAYLIVQDDGRVAIFNAAGEMIWKT